MDESITSKCYKTNPNMPVFFSFRRSLFCVLSYYIGLLPFLPLKESCFEVMMPSIFLNKCRCALNGFESGLKEKKIIKEKKKIEQKKRKKERTSSIEMEKIVEKKK